MSKEFAKMEEAAMKAYQEDLKRMEREAAGRLFFFFLNLSNLQAALLTWTNILNVSF